MINRKESQLLAQEHQNRRQADRRSPAKPLGQPFRVSTPSLATAGKPRG